MTLNSRNLEAKAYAQDFSGRIWILEVTGEIELPQTYKAVTVRPHIPRVFNPTILALDIIPLGDDLAPDVMTWERFGYQELGTDRPEYAQILLMFADLDVATVDIEYIES